jgi:branched-chain amino acid transport system ATP-binding protein
MKPLLKVSDAVASYGAVRALKGISFEVGEGEIVTLVGANGAGKTTTLRTISGLLHPQGGSIEFAGRRIDRLAPEAVVKLGISHCSMSSGPSRSLRSSGPGWAGCSQGASSRCWRSAGA